jgi:trehalose 2-sulfotransferase
MPIPPNLKALFVEIQSIMSEDFDTGPYECRFRYFLCSSPRSGSSMVAAALRDTGSAGVPHEYLNANYVKAFARRQNVPDVSRTYWKFLESRRCTPNGAFGVKAHFRHLSVIFREPDQQLRFLQRFHKFVIISRRNAVAQALSYVKANSTHVWNTDNADTLAEVRSIPFSPSTGAVARALGYVITQNTAWPQKLREIGADFITVYYEDLVEDFLGEMDRIVKHLSIPELVIESIAAPRSLKLSDESADLLQERFLRDIVGTTQPDEPPAATLDSSLLETTHE